MDSFRRRRCFELAVTFLRLGTTAFGGPAAHIAMMEQEFVRRRAWLKREEFLDLLGVVNLIPGPNSTEMAILIGYREAGWMGLLLGGSCFVLPAMMIVMAIAWLYVQYGSLPQMAAVLYGIKPVIIAIILQALWGLARTAVKSPVLAAIGLAAVAVSFTGIQPLVVLFAAGLLAMIARSLSASRGTTSRASAPVLALAGLSAPVAATAPFSLPALFLVFLKIGAVLFGSGYVLLAFLRADFVERRHWLTETQLLNAVAVGQFTPGPLFTTATFIGYLLGGIPAAIVATVAIFLPAFVFVFASGPLVAKIRQSRSAGSFLDGVIVASLALMCVVTWQLSRGAIVDALTAILAVVAAVLLLRYRVNSAWLVLGGAAAGLISTLLAGGNR